MDPVSAFSLACNVIQFVEFTIKIVSKGNKLRAAGDGRLVEHADLHSASLRTIALNNALVTSANEHSRNVALSRTVYDREIEQTCRAASQCAVALVSALDKLRLPLGAGRWSSMRQAIKSVMGKEEVDRIRNELDVQRQRMNAALLASLWNKMNQVLHNLGHGSAVESTTELDEKQRHKAVNRLFWSHPAPPTWQKRLTYRVLENGWTPSKAHEVASFNEAITDVAARENATRGRSQIVHQLSFPDMHDREFRIPEAHVNTLQWLFAGPTHQHQRGWSSLVHWLEGNARIYWIAGKPGSGKSTLMKFLVHDPRTQQHLQIWAAGRPLVTAQFYFWNSGSQEQMSLLGFYRTVVYAVLRCCPNMVEVALPHRWRTSELFGQDIREWAVDELEFAFRKVLEESGRSFKLCLFIDGLDEYNGDHASFVEMLSTIAERRDVKLCLASRPWPTFEAAFSKESTMMLQNLTFPDILRYTRTKLHSHPRFHNLVSSEPAYAENLVLNIAKKAEGVFLWVCLVTKSLLEGLTNADCVSDLQERLEEIPGDLEEFYSKILHSITDHPRPSYRNQASRYFRIARAAKGRLTALAFSFADETEPEYALKRKSSPISPEERHRRADDIRIRLNDRCKGFLEIPNKVTTTESANLESLASDEEADMRVEVDEADRKVTYLHRTAKDFLESSDVQSRIASLCTADFEPYSRILGAYLLLLKCLPSEDRTQSIGIWRIVDEMIWIAEQSPTDAESDAMLIRHLDQMDRVAAELLLEAGFCKNGQHWTASRPGSKVSSTSFGFLGYIAESRLTQYIVRKLDDEAVLSPDVDNLAFVVKNYREYPALCAKTPEIHRPLPCLSIITKVLHKGDNPNTQLGEDSTPWTLVLDEACEAAADTSLAPDARKEVLFHWAQVANSFLDHEADPLRNRDSSQASRIRDAFGMDLPEQSRHLERKLKRTKTRWSVVRKYITPRNRKLDRLHAVDMTPLPVLLRLQAAEQPRGWFHHSSPVGSNSVPEGFKFWDDRLSREKHPYPGRFERIGRGSQCTGTDNYLEQLSSDPRSERVGRNLQSTDTRSDDNDPTGYEDMPPISDDSSLVNSFERLGISQHDPYQHIDSNTQAGGLYSIGGISGAPSTGSSGQQDLNLEPLTSLPLPESWANPLYGTSHAVPDAGRHTHQPGQHGQRPPGFQPPGLQSPGTWPAEAWMDSTSPTPYPNAPSEAAALQWERHMSQQQAHAQQQMLQRQAHALAMQPADADVSRNRGQTNGLHASQDRHIRSRPVAPAFHTGYAQSYPVPGDWNEEDPEDVRGRAQLLTPPMPGTRPCANPPRWPVPESPASYLPEGDSKVTEESSPDTAEVMNPGREAGMRSQSAPSDNSDHATFDAATERQRRDEFWRSGR